MSVEEDTELKNLVAQTLENKGVLPKIRAELRANVFLALEENPSTKETLLRNDGLTAFAKTPIGELIFNLIREFLEYFELDFTLSVFDPETKYGKDYNSLSKEKMMKVLKITDCAKKSPLLYEIIEKVIVNNAKVSNEKSVDFNQDISGSGDSVPLVASPVGLNSTYVKNKSDADSVPESPKDESIKEEFTSNNISESESAAESKVVLDKNNEVQSSTPPAVAKEPIEIDLLTFTPVKESKSKEKMKNSNPSNEPKETPKSMSILGNLPPLNPKMDEKESKINEIKAIMNNWTDLDNESELSVGSKTSTDGVPEDKLSAQLKSDKSEVSQKSDKTETGDDFEEDISDLINGHTPSDQLTVDETISKVSCSADYLESL